MINQFVGLQTSYQTFVNKQNSIKQEAKGHQDTGCHRGSYNVGAVLIAFTLNLYYEESGAAGPDVLVY